MLGENDTQADQADADFDLDYGSDFDEYGSAGASGDAAQRPEAQPEPADEDLEADAGDEAQQAAEPEPEAEPAQPEAEPAYVADLRRQLTAANAKVEKLTSEFGPYLQGLRTQAQQQASRPPLTPEQIAAGQFTPAQFEQYMDWKLEQRLRSVEQQAVSATEYARSQAEARAMFTAEAVGDPTLAYESLVNDYFAPAYATNPALKDAVAAIMPENPAAGEFLLGAMFRAYQANNGDLIKTARAILGKSAATAKPVVNPRRAAQQRQAAMIERGGRAPGQRRPSDPNDRTFDEGRMSDREFRQFLNQIGDASDFG